MMGIKPAIAAASLAFLFVAAPAFAQGGLTGNWELTLTTPQGSNTVALSLKQEGEKVTGDLNTPMGSLPVTGSSSNGALTLSASVELQGNKLELGLAGKVDGDALSGTVKFGDFGEFPFSGKRAAAAAAPAASSAAAPAPTPVAGGGGANGKWDIVFKVEGAGDLPASATLRQESDQVTGVLSSQGGEVQLKGTMSGNYLKLAFSTSTPQGDLSVTMTGELGPSGFAGKASFGGLAEANWTATRAK